MPNAQEYEALLLQYEAWKKQQRRPVSAEQIELSLQATILMTLPENCYLRDVLPGPMPHMFHLDQGIGYSRLCSQIVAYLSGLENIWLLDDNVQQCFRLDYEPGLTNKKLYHSREALKPVCFDEAMQAVERAVLHQAEWLVRQVKGCVSIFHWLTADNLLTSQSRMTAAAGCRSSGLERFV